MRLIDALRYTPGSNIAFVGAGGKTTALFRIAKEIISAYSHSQTQQTVFITTTTHFGSWQSALADHVIQKFSLTDISHFAKQIPDGVVLLSGDENNDRLSGLTDELLDPLYRFSIEHNIPLLIEADGSHLHALKAPARHEPVIPSFVNAIIVVAGMQGLGKPLTDEWIHRPDKFAELSGLKIGELVTGNALVNVLLHPEGGLKGMPTQARKIALLNQADTTELQSQAKRISERLIASYHSCIVSSLSPAGLDVSSIPETYDELQTNIYAVIEPIGGIILAAGGSSRFGELKQLLNWNGEPMIRSIAKLALKAGLSPVIVVIGAAAQEVAATINDLPLRIVNNLEWSAGLSTSIKAGIHSIPKEIGGVVFLQGDQPQIPLSLIRSLIEAHQISLDPIVATLIDGQRGNPVLFDQSTLSKFYSLKGDVGGRSLFSEFHVQWVNWHDKNLLLDIDTPKDYEQLLTVYSQYKDNQ
jgi:molybdenum cofactor cytidylyltransferase